jgi:drug/metabolite transporter (DMT)-like permease
MTSLAIILVLTAAFCHAAWNFLTKKVCGGTVFIWLFSGLAALLYLPVMLWTIVTTKPEFSLYTIYLLIGSVVLHLAYFYLLNKGYEYGELSVIYPVARGTGPLLTMIAATLLLGERPTAIALSGAMLIGLGIIVITGNPFTAGKAHPSSSIYYALLCGTAIAGYTIIDKIAVSTFLLPPLLVDWCTNFGRFVLLLPYASKNGGKVKELWRCYKKEVIGVAVLSPLAYILVLTAMIDNPVSYIAPAREISILIGTILGSKLLLEENMKTKLTGCAAMLIGLIGLSVG